MRRSLIAVVTAGTMLTVGAGAASAAPGVTHLRAPAPPLAGVMADDKLWVLVDRAGGDALVQLDRRARPTGREVPIGDAGEGRAPIAPVSPGSSLVRHGGALWTIDHATDEVVKVDPASARVIARTDLGRRPTFLAAGAAGLWVIDRTGRPTADGEGTLWSFLRLDPDTLAIAREIVVGPGLGSLGPVELAVDRGTLRTSWPGPARTRRDLDLRTERFVPSRGGPWQMLVAGTSVVSTFRNACGVHLQGPHARVGRSRSTRARTVPMLRRRSCFPRAVAAGPGRQIWSAYRLSRSAPGVLVRRSQATGRTRTYRVGREPVDIVGNGRDAWVLSKADRRVSRIRVG